MNTSRIFTSSRPAGVLLSGIIHLFLPALLALLLMATGCGDTEQEETGTRDTPGTGIDGDSSARNDTARPDTNGIPEGPGRPATKIDTLRIEGNPEPVQLELVSEGLPFSTYLPKGDFKVEQSSSGEGIGVRFIASFGGKVNNDAYLSIFIPNENYSLDRMKEFVAGNRSLAQSNNWRLEEPVSPRCEWAHVSYLLYDTAKDAIGHICIGRHAGQSFYAVMHYPEEYADGFGPRASIILKELRWNDTKEGIERE